MGQNLKKSRFTNKYPEKCKRNIARSYPLDKSGGVYPILSRSRWNGKNRDGEILIHGNGRCGHYKKLVFRSKIEKCKQFSSGRIWDFDGISPSRSAVPVIYTLETLSWDPLYVLVDKVGLYLDKVGTGYMAVSYTHLTLPTICSV